MIISANIPPVLQNMLNVYGSVYMLLYMSCSCSKGLCRCATNRIFPVRCFKKLRTRTGMSNFSITQYAIMSGALATRYDKRQPTQRPKYQQENDDGDNCHDIGMMVSSCDTLTRTVRAFDSRGLAGKVQNKWKV